MKKNTMLLVMREIKNQNRNIYIPPDLKTEIWYNQVLMNIWRGGNSHAADGREKNK